MRSLFTDKLGLALKKLRFEKGYTQEQIELSTGLSTVSLGAWEGGKVAPNVDNLKQLVQFYKTPLWVVLKEVEEELMTEELS